MIQEISWFIWFCRISGLLCEQRKLASSAYRTDFRQVILGRSLTNRLNKDGPFFEPCIIDILWFVTVSELE